MRKKNERGK